MTALRTTPYPTTPLLSWDAETRTFATEMSTLKGNAIRPQRLYDDAADWALVFVGETGRVVNFFHQGEVRDVEGELLYTRYAPDTTPSADPDLAGVELHVFND